MSVGTTGDGKGLTQDAVIDKLMPDPAQPISHTTVFEGLLGKSTRQGYWRLYFTSELNDYVEFREGDVLSSEKIPLERSRLGLESTRVWIRRDAAIDRTRTQSLQAHAVSPRFRMTAPAALRLRQYSGLPRSRSRPLARLIPDDDCGCPHVLMDGEHMWELVACDADEGTCEYEEVGFV